MTRALEAIDMRAAGRMRSPWDYTLIGTALALAAIGLIMVYSASVDYATRVQGTSTYFLLHHASYLTVGLVIAAITVRTRVRWWEAGGPYLLLFGIGALVLVLVPGIGMHVNGSSRWLRLGIVTLHHRNGLILHGGDTVMRIGALYIAMAPATK